MKPARSQAAAAQPVKARNVVAATAAAKVTSRAKDVLADADDNCSFAFNEADFIFDAPTFVDLAREQRGYNEEEYVVVFTRVFFFWFVRFGNCLPLTISS
jgi:hypothetical protein